MGEVIEKDAGVHFQKCFTPSKKTLPTSGCQSFVFLWCLRTHEMESPMGHPTGFVIAKIWPPPLPFVPPHPTHNVLTSAPHTMHTVTQNTQMGRLDSSRKGNIARKRRLQELSEEFEADRALRVEESLDAAKPDEELFFVDTSAATSLPPTKSKAEKRRRFFSEKVSCVAMPSVHLVKAVERIVKGQQSGKVGGEVKTGTGPNNKPTKATLRSKSVTKKDEEEIYDIWGTETGGKKGGKGKGKKGKKAGPVLVPKSKLRVLKAPLASLVPLIAKPLGGQSYHPSAEEHQEALSVAVAVEEKRDAALAKMKAPLAVMSEATKALLLRDSEEEDEGEEGQDEEEEKEGAEEEKGEVLTKRMLRRKGKMTKAERNKQRRRKAMEHQAVLDKEQNALSQQASRAREHAKALRREDKAVKKEKKKGSGSSRNRPFAPLDLPTVPVPLPQDKDPLRTRSLAVPLSDELKGSLRALRTKGSLASETLDGLQRRGQYEVVPQRKSARPRQRVKYVEKFRGE